MEISRRRNYAENDVGQRDEMFWGTLGQQHRTNRCRFFEKTGLEDWQIHDATIYVRGIRS